MADYIETIPQDKFDMKRFRSGELGKHECNSVGCVIGHCTIPDKNPLPTGLYGDIDFDEWSRNFTDLKPYSSEWSYLFSFDWFAVDNTPTGAASRIRHFLEKGLPEDWSGQMEGKAPLSYINQTK